uniref:Ig-like domain-containing protein n=1 Tax=Bos indicus x Bos taurus TaxID=30522 RepID=A0A4W2GNI5_BOBOX
MEVFGSFIPGSFLAAVLSQYTLDQSPSFLSIQERTHDDLNCTYQKKTFYHLVWFEQEPGKGLVSLSLIQSSQKEEADKNFKELLGKEKVYSVLHISASHPGDSAIYFCALRRSTLQAPAACPTTASWAS